MSFNGFLNLKSPETFEFNFSKIFKNDFRFFVRSLNELVSLLNPKIVHSSPPKKRFQYKEQTIKPLQLNQKFRFPSSRPVRASRKHFAIKVFHFHETTPEIIIIKKTSSERREKKSFSFSISSN